MREKGVDVQIDPALPQRGQPASSRRRRIYRNDAERRFVELASSEGWTVTKRGWPDFVCFRGDEVRVVEVKPYANSQPKAMQSKVIALLRAHGICALVWSPSGGFKPSGGWPARKT
jgi:hypothetical protein